MTVPAYTDISHFRAPYKNAYFSGYGADVTPGTPPPPPEPEPLPPLLTTATMVTQGKDGYRRLKPEFQGLIDNILASEWATGPEQAGGVELKPMTEVFTSEQLAATATDPKMRAAIAARSAYAWSQKQAKDGRVVLIHDATLNLLVSAGLMKTTGLPTRLLSAPLVLGSLDKASPKLQEAKGVANSAVVLAGTPSDATEKTAGAQKELPLATVGIALGAVVIVGGVYLLTRKKGAAPKL